MEEAKAPVQQVTTKDPKKVAAGKKLAEYNKKKKEELKNQQEQQQNHSKSEEIDIKQYFGVGAIIGVVGLGGIVYYLYQKDKNVPVPEKNNPTIRVNHQHVNKFEME